MFGDAGTREIGRRVAATAGPPVNAIGIGLLAFLSVAPLGEGALIATGLSDAAEATAEPVITFGHGARHLAGTGLAKEAVEAAIKQEVKQSVKGASATGNFWGKVVVNGKTIIYRVYTLGGRLHVGT